MHSHRWFERDISRLWEIHTWNSSSPKWRKYMTFTLFPVLDKALQLREIDCENFQLSKEYVESLNSCHITHLMANFFKPLSSFFINFYSMFPYIWFEIPLTSFHMFLAETVTINFANRFIVCSPFITNEISWFEHHWLAFNFRQHSIEQFEEDCYMDIIFWTDLHACKPYYLLHRRVCQPKTKCFESINACVSWIEICILQL